MGTDGARDGARHVLTILATDDVRRLRDFYVAAFGWQVVVDVPVYVELALPGGMRLGCYARPGFASNTGAAPAARPLDGTTATEIYVRVEDVGAWADRLLAAGATLLSPAAPRDWGDEVAYFADPEGNVLALARELDA